MDLGSIVEKAGYLSPHFRCHRAIERLVGPPFHHSHGYLNDIGYVLGRVLHIEDMSCAVAYKLS